MSAVYANQPLKYKVVDPVGSIKAKCCIDIVVRHTSPGVQAVNVTDKFRVDIVEFGHKEASQLQPLTSGCGRAAAMERQPDVSIQELSRGLCPVTNICGVLQAGGSR